MRSDLQKKLLQREMTRKEFLQFAGSSLLILFGLSNFLTLVNHLSKPAKVTTTSDQATHGFGSRKFGA